eukprot:gene10522-biopygen1664
MLPCCRVARRVERRAAPCCRAERRVASCCYVAVWAAPCGAVRRYVPCGQRRAAPCGAMCKLTNKHDAN